MRSRFLAAGAIVAAVGASVLAGLSQTAGATGHTGCKPGNVVATYHTTVANRPDSGLHGDWATDTFQRTTVVSTDCNGHFTLKISDYGHFNTIPGKTSPGNLGLPLPNYSIKGEFQGGAIVDVTPPVGGVPHDPGPAGGVSGQYSTSQWAGLVFTGGEGKIHDWHWWYTACNEKWVNAESGNSGDVTGRYCRKHEHDRYPRVELSIKTTKCDGATEATATLTVEVYGKHGDVVAHYEAGDQQGDVTVGKHKHEATKTLTFENGSGHGKIHVLFWYGEYKKHAKHAVVCTDCETPPSSSSSAPPTSTSTSTSTSTPADQGDVVPPKTSDSAAPVVVHQAANESGSGLAYTGASVWVPLTAGALLLAGGAFALVYGRRRQRNGGDAQTGSHRT